MHLVIGTPMHGGLCCSEYVKSLMALQSSLEKGGHQLTGVFLGNESLIQRGRNTIAHIFLEHTNASHILFMDGDQGFRAADIAKMLKEDKGIIAGAVPMKGINWARVEQGANQGYEDLSELTGIFNIQELPGHSMVNPNQPFEVKYAGTGFMLIQRKVFEELKPHTDWYFGSNSIPSTERVYNYFKVENVEHELLSEDFHFCHMYREHCGGKIWMAPWCEVVHFGAYHFSGQYNKSFLPLDNAG